MICLIFCLASKIQDETKRNNWNKNKLFEVVRGGGDAQVLGERITSGHQL